MTAIFEQEGCVARTEVLVVGDSAAQRPRRSLPEGGRKKDDNAPARFCTLILAASK
jgi:hypothetical protein